MKIIHLLIICTTFIIVEGSAQDVVYQVLEKVLNQLENILESIETFYDNVISGSDHDNQKVYDYIVVGSGAAGSVVANRLSENSQVKVLLLESGDFPIFHSEIPFLASLQQFTRQNWGYLMEKQANFCLGLTNELMHWPSGRVLGGSSVINYMMLVRGNKLDYDRWARLGNPGWSYDEVKPYFIKSENAKIAIQDIGYHGHNGTLSVQDVSFRTKSVDVFVEGCKQAGYMYVDYNGANQMGVSYLQSTTRQGRRCSAEKAFIRPARFRPNLDIRLNSHVTKVLIDSSTKKAYGVEYLYLNKKYVVNASIEVIISAGVFHSPQILMLSGIGPQDHLTEVDIPVLKNLPVGKKLYDHLVFLGLVFTVNKPIVINFLETLAPISILNYIIFGSGSLTTLGGLESVIYFKTSSATFLENYPDIELIFAGGGLQTDYGVLFRRMFRVSDKVYKAIWEPLYFKYAFSIVPVLLHPKSSGYMKLRSQNPLDPPLLYGNYFTDPEQSDAKAFIAAIRECQRIIQSPIFREYETTLVNTTVPGCEGKVFDTDAYWLCALRHISASLFHQTSTCKMGDVSDPEAVVDSKCRVHGIKRLRVIDTSIIPTTLSAHTNGPAFMIGEKGADYIKQDYAKLVLENMS